jgi:hypothetical protein
MGSHTVKQTHRALGMQKEGPLLMTESVQPKDFLRLWGTQDHCKANERGRVTMVDRWRCLRQRV